MKPIRPIVIACLLIFASCMSIDHASGPTGVLSGMVYDYENRPVYGYEITLHPFRKTVTDINGHFTFPDTGFGSYRIEGKGSGFCSCELTLNFLDPKQIVYLRIPSNDWIYCTVDGNLESGRYEEARSYLAMLPSTEKRKETFRMYTTILAFLESGEPTLLGSYFKSVQPGRNRDARNNDK